MPVVRPFLLSFVLLLLVAVVEAAEAPCQPDLTGKWSGCWVSESDGHHGPLHAHFYKENDCNYRVHFHGRFFKIIPFRYSVTLTIVGHDGDNVLLAGSQRLGPIFGTFEYSATANDREFTATFSSKRDCGRFELTRDCR